jgi:xylulokinase
VQLNFHRISIQHKKIQKEEVGWKILNALSPGFLLPSLMWIKDHEPFNYEK